MLRYFFLLAALVVEPLAREDVLEPSVQNEVDHALARAADCTSVTSTPPASVKLNHAALDFARLYATNGLSATAKALALVSSQRADGRWYVGTNDVTAAAVSILKSL